MKRYIAVLTLCFALGACAPAAPEPSAEEAGASSQSSMASSASTSAVSIDELVQGEWEEFESDTYGYSLSLPEEFSILSDGMEEPHVHFSTPAGSPYLVVHIFPSTSSLDAYLSKHDADSSTAYEGEASMEVLASSPTTVDDREAVIRRERWYAAGFDAVTLYVKSGDRVYQFSIYHGKEMTVDSSLLSFAERVFGGLDWK